MGRTVRQLGALSGADMSISPDGKNFTWFTSDLADPIQIYVRCPPEPRKLFTGGRGGAQTITWMIPGRTCTFELVAGGKTELSLFVDTRQGFPLSTRLIRPAAPAPVTTAGPTAAPPPEPTLPANGTLFSGIPDTYLAIGGGILLIALLAKKKRR